MECSDEVISELGSKLLDDTLTIDKRFRALFSLRNLNGDAAREALSTAMRDESCLLAHEAAFALGQMQRDAAIPALREVLEDTSYHPMVRHEAAEALGAIGNSECREILIRSLNDKAVEVRETSELALSRIEEMIKSKEKNKETPSSAPSPFLSVDPALATYSDYSINDLRNLLLNEKAKMYDRYGALFTLRNRRTQEAIEAIILALHASSALLRHEVAYVLGQLQDQKASNALMRTLENVEEHPMVRHEAAEALGAIADLRSLELLKKFQKDPDPIVAQSCEVALDMLKFELQEDAFQYADVGVGQLA